MSSITDRARAFATNGNTSTGHQDNDSNSQNPSSGLENGSGGDSNRRDQGAGLNSNSQNPSSITGSGGEPNILGSGHWKKKEGQGPGEAANGAKDQAAESQNPISGLDNGSGGDSTDQSNNLGSSREHKSHRGLHGHGPGEAEKANCGSCTRDRAAGSNPLGQDTSEQTTQAYRGAAGDDPSAGTGNTDRYAGSGTGTDNQYPPTGTEHHHHHHKHHPEGGQSQPEKVTGGYSQEVTDAGGKPSMSNKILGKAEQMVGQAASKLGADSGPGIYQRGADRAAGNK